jgi:hypothetical protein
MSAAPPERYISACITESTHEVGDHWVVNTKPTPWTAATIGASSFWMPKSFLSLSMGFKSPFRSSSLYVAS